MTTDQNAREAAALAYGILSNYGVEYAPLHAAIDAYLAALPLPDDAARAAVEAELGRMRSRYHESMQMGIAAEKRADAAEAALAQMTRERDEARAYGAAARIRENAADDARIHEHDRAEAAEAALATMTAERDRLREALVEAEELIALSEHPAHPDPLYHEEVKRLGNRIGFGALMSTASAGWRERLAEHGGPAGGEYVAGPCFGSVQRTLGIVRRALTGGDGGK